MMTEYPSLLTCLNVDRIHVLHTKRNTEQHKTAINRYGGNLGCNEKVQTEVKWTSKRGWRLGKNMFHVGGEWDCFCRKATVHRHERTPVGS